MRGPSAWLTAKSSRAQPVCNGNEPSAQRAWGASTLGAMADHDRAAARREITDALIAALDRRHEVLDAIVDADNRAAAVEAVATLLGIASVGAEAVVAMPLHRLTKDSRQKIA